MKYLVTGVAGFIGFHLAKKLLEMNFNVVGIDNINDYYDVNLKFNRLNELGVQKTNFIYGKSYFSSKFKDFKFIKIDIADKKALSEIFKTENFDFVLNFAAQAGVMYSKENPDAYIHSNILGFINILECCKKQKSKLIYASSSSVYGGNTNMPFSENDEINSPKNLYAKTKIQNEYLAQIYSDYFNLQTIGLRMFSVYGPFGRPDMVCMLFAKAIKNRESIKIYGDGSAKRDYTFVEDVVNSIVKLMNFYNVKQANNEIFNIGSQRPVELSELIKKLEVELGAEAIKDFLPPRPEEIDMTFADTTKLEKTINYKPNTLFEVGLNKFVEWFKKFENE